MAQFIDPERLHQLSTFVGQPLLSPDHGIPVLRWTLDAATGRPISRWELAVERSSSSLLAASLAASTCQRGPRPSRQCP
jgi:hypothetical protein